jgi:S1-C subfamily serine protease
MLSLVLTLLVHADVETVPSREFSKEMQAAAATATVGVRNTAAGVDGSGVVVGRNGPFVYILTAHHLLDRAKGIEIAVYSARSYPRVEKTYTSAELLAVSPDSDLALLRLATRDALPELRICTPSQAPEGKDFVVLTVGCDGGAPTCAVDRVKEKKRVQKGKEEGSAFCWETGVAPKAGRSGGPLLDREGRLIGVCSGANDGKGYYAHLEEIQRFLKRNGLNALYEEKAR